MNQSLAIDFVEDVNLRIEAARLLEQLGYATDKIQVVGDSVKAFCPIHRDTKFRSLVIDSPKHSFKCTIKSCPGHGGGTLVDLYALAERLEPVAAASRLVGALGLDIDPAWNEKLVGAQLESARHALEAGELTSAEDAARAALSFQPDSVQAHLVLAKVYSGRNEPELACSEFAAAVDALLSRSEFPEATRIIEEAIACFPDSEDLFFLQVRSAELQGNTDEVVRLLEELAGAREAAGLSHDNLGIYQRLIELQPENASPRLRLADLHESRRDMRTAAREMEKAAMLLLKQERGSEAVPLLEKILRCEPQQKRLRLLLADELIGAGEYVRAKEQIFEVANQQIENSEFVAAETTVRRWLDIEPDSLETFEVLARIFQDQDRASDAANALRQASEAALRNGGLEAALPFLFRIKYLQPDDIELRQKLVESLLDQGEPQRAGFELLDLAEVHFSREETSDAEGVLKRAATIDPSASCKLQIAEVLRSHGLVGAACELALAGAEAAETENSLELAQSAFELLAELQPDSLEIAEQRVKLLWRGSSSSAAEATVSLLERLSGEGRDGQKGELLGYAAEHVQSLSGRETPEPYRRLFLFAAETGDAAVASKFYALLAPPLADENPAAALDCAKLLTGLDPANCRAHREIAKLTRELGDSQSAADAFLAVAVLEEEQGNSAEALESLEAASSCAPDRPELLKRKAELIERVSGTATAASAYRDYLTALRQSVSVDEALREYEGYLAEKPSDVVARRHLADFLAGLDRREEAGAIYLLLLDEAEGDDDVIEVLHLREALLALDPNDPARQSKLADALLEVGDPAHAIRLYHSAALSYLQSDSPVEAARTLREALKSEPENLDLLELLVRATESEGEASAHEAALVSLAGALRNLKRFDATLEALGRLIALVPDNTFYREEQASNLDLCGRTEDALQAWKDLARTLEQAQDRRAALDIYKLVGNRLAGDLETLNHWHTLAKGDQATPADEALAAAALAISYLDCDQQSNAEAHVETLLKLAGPCPAEACSQLVIVARRMKPSAQTALAYVTAASGYDETGQGDLAVETLMEAISADPSNLAAREKLVDFYDSRHDAEGAFEQRIAILGLPPTTADASLWQKQLKKLRKHSASDPKRRLAIARALLANGSDSTQTEAIVELEGSVRTAMEAGDADFVIEACDVSLEISAASPVLRGAKADLLSAEGRMDDAGAWLQQCVETALKDSHPEDAEEAVTRWLELLPSDPDAHELSGTVYRMLDRPDDAGEAYKAAAEVWQANAEYMNAARCLRAASEMLPSDLNCRQRLWELLLEGGYETEALSEMQALADLLAARGSHDEALTLLERLLKRQPQSLPALTSYAELLYGRDGFEGTLPVYQRLLQLKRETAPPDETVAAYEAVLGLAGAPIELRAEYADFLEKADRSEVAKSQLLQVAQYYRDDAADLVRAVEYFGRATASSHSVDDASIFEELAALHLALKVPVFATGALREAARLYDNGGKSAAAIQCARQALELSEGSQRIEDLTLLGVLLTRTGKLAEGTKHLREALSIAASDQDVSRERRRELCSAVLEADPGDLATAEMYLDLLPDTDLPDCAVALSHRMISAGKENERVQLLKRAKIMAPDSLAIRCEMADALSGAGQSSEDLQRELIELCEMAGRTKDVGLAADTLKKLEAIPTAAQSPLLLAPLYALAGNTETAVARYATAAEDLATEDRFDEAAEALRNAIDLDPPSVPAATVATIIRHSRAAESLRVQADRLLETAVRARSRTRALVVATALLEQSSADEGQQILLRIAQGAGAAFVVAVAGAHADWLYERERADEAASLVDFVTDLVPNSPDAWWLASQLHRKTGQNQPSADAALKAARLFNEAGAVTEEESCYQEALNQFPDDIPVLETLAFFYDREKRVGNALDVMRRLASLTQSAGNLNATANWMRKIIALAPTDENDREKFAEVLLQLKRTDEAAGHLLELARACAKRGEEVRAENFYERLLAVEPDCEKAAAYLLELATRRDDAVAITRYTIAIAYVKAESGALHQACQLLKNLLMREPDNLDALEKLAAFSKRAQDIPTYRSATLSLAVKLVQHKDYMGAILQLDSLLESHPGDLEVLQILVDCCTAEGMLERGADFAQQLLDGAREIADMRRIVAASNAILSYDTTKASVRQDLAEALLCMNRIPEAVTEWIRAAEDFVTLGELSSAADCCRRVTQVAPSNLNAWKRLADILAFADQPDEARETYLYLAGAYASSGDSAAAIAVIRRLSQLDPLDALPHEHALRIHLEANNHPEAIEEILWLVRHHTRRNDLPAAERLVEQGVGIDPESLTLQQCRLEIVRGLGRPDELRLRTKELADRFKEAGDLRKAADTLEQVIEMDSNQPAVRQELGELWLSLGEQARAHEQFGLLVEGILKRADPEEARDAAEGILRAHHNDVSLRAHLAKVFTDHGLQEVGGRYYATCASKAAEAGDTAAQVEYLKLASQARPRWTEGLRQLAEASAAAGTPDHAFESFRRLAALLMETKEFSEAASAIRRQISLKPKDPAPRIQLADLYTRIGDREQRGLALQDLADLYISRGQTDEAVEVYRQLIDLKPDDPEILQRFVELFAQVGNELEIVDEYLRLADALTKKGAFVEATQTYEQILAIDRRNPVIREKFINFLQNHGQKGRALAEMRRLADTYVKRGNRTSAVNVLVNALAISPRDAELCLRLAAAYETVGNQEASVQCYTRAASMLADTAPVRAIDLYTKLLEKDPQNPEMRRRLAESYARAGEQSRAASQARKLAELHCARGEVEQAEAAYRMVSSNRPEELTTLRDAVQLHAHDPMLQYVDLIRYGDALLEAGNIDEALDQYRKARALNDDRPQIIQKCIDALCQIAPEREAIPDMLMLAEKYVMAAEPANARELYERILRLDSACESAKAGRDTAFRMELMVGTNPSSVPDPLDMRPIKSSTSTPNKARVGMNDILGAFDNNEERVAGED